MYSIEYTKYSFFILFSIEYIKLNIILIEYIIDYIICFFSFRFNNTVYELVYDYNLNRRAILNIYNFFS